MQIAAAGISLPDPRTDLTFACHTCGVVGPAGPHLVSICLYRQEGERRRSMLCNGCLAKVQGWIGGPQCYVCNERPHAPEFPVMLQTNYGAILFYCCSFACSEDGLKEMSVSTSHRVVTRFPDRTCGGCQRPETRAKPLRRCGRCKSISYCCKACQTRDWPSHKQSCRAVKPEKDLVVASDRVGPVMAMCCYDKQTGAIGQKVILYKHWSVENTKEARSGADGAAATEPRTADK